MQTKDFKIIIGLGKTGLAVAEYLTKNKISFALADTRETPPDIEKIKKHYPHCEIQLGELDEKFLSTASELIVSPGVSINEPAIQACIKRGISAVGDIELFARVAKAPVCAITGSNAKSTVTSLVYAMAKKAGINAKIGGNIGTPALELLEKQEPELYVLELSSFQLETTFSLKPKAATILNISADHLDRYDSVQDYADAKQRIYNDAKNIIYNRLDEYTKPKNSVQGTLHSFALNKPPEKEFGLIESANTNYLSFGSELLISVDELSLSGKHQWENALAALALGAAMEIPLTAMIATLKEFPGLPHRCQKVIEHNQIAWYNDSKGTNVGATLAAIEGIGATTKGKILLIAGGLGKGADFSPLKESFKKYVKTLILMGTDADKIAAITPKNIEIIHVDDMPSAVMAAKRQSEPHDAVLLSPACASWDMFNNFEHRGDVFTENVKQLVEKN